MSTEDLIAIDNQRMVGNDPLTLSTMEDNKHIDKSLPMSDNAEFMEAASHSSPKRLEPKAVVIKTKSPNKNSSAMLKTISQYGDYEEAAQPRRDVLLMQQQQRGFFNRRLQQNQLLTHSFPAGYSLQAARRDAGEFDYSSERRRPRPRMQSPSQSTDNHNSTNSFIDPSNSLLFPSKFSNNPAAVEALAGPYVDLGVYGGPVSSSNPQAEREKFKQNSLSDSSFNASQLKIAENNMRKFSLAASKGKSNVPDGLVKGTSAYSQAVAKSRVSAITSSHTGASYTSWMRGSAYDERSNEQIFDDENAAGEGDDEASDPFADCAGPTLTMLRRLRQQQGVKLPSDTYDNSKNNGGWALTGQKISLTIPSQPVIPSNRNHSHDAHSVFSGSLASSAISNNGLPMDGSKPVHRVPSSNQQTSLPKVYHAPAMLPALHLSSVPSGIAPVYLATSTSRPLYSPNSSTSAPDTAMQTILGMNAPFPQPLMPTSEFNNEPQGIIEYSSWIVHQRQEREAHNVWRQKGNDPENNYSLYHGVVNSGLSTSAEKIAWLVEQGVEPGLQPHVLQDMLLRPDAALPQNILLCLFSATQILKAIPNSDHRARSVNSDIEDGKLHMPNARPGTEVFIEPQSPMVALEGEGSISKFGDLSEKDNVQSTISVKNNNIDSGIAVDSSQEIRGNGEEIDNLSYHSHQSLQSLLSNDEGGGEPTKTNQKKKRKSSIHGVDAAITVGEHISAQQQQNMLISDSIGDNGGGIVGSSASTLNKYPSSLKMPVVGLNGNASQWLTDGVQRWIPTQSSLRYLQEVIVHDIAEAILTAFPTYHHEVLKNKNATKVLSATDLQHQKHLIHSLEKEYYCLAKDLASDMKLQVFDHRDRTWRSLKNESDWQRGILNTLLYPDNPLQHRIEVMYHLPLEIEAQLKRHLLAYRHTHRHEAQQLESVLGLAQAVITGVLQSEAISTSNNSNSQEINNHSKSMTDVIERKEKQLPDRLSVSISTTTLGNSEGISSPAVPSSTVGSAILNQQFWQLQQLQQQNASRHFQDSLTALTAALDHPLSHSHSNNHLTHQSALGSQQNRTYHQLGPLFSTLQNNANAGSVSSHASLGSSLSKSFGGNSSMTGHNPLLIRNRILSSSTAGSAKHVSSTHTAEANNSQSEVRTPPLTVVKAPSLLYPQAQHYKVQSLKHRNECSLPKLQAMAESLEQRLLLTRWT